jgi:hypothetical protein
VWAALGKDGEWLSVLAVVTTLELGWWAFTWSVGATSAPWVTTYILIGAAGVAAAGLLRFLAGRGTPPADWLGIMLGTALTGVGASAFLPLKYAIPQLIPFWLDGPLAVAERHLFGVEPWLLLDRMFWWATIPLDRLYGCWLPLQLLVMFSVMIARPSAAKSRALIAYSLAWLLLGVVAALLLASAGPIFYDRLFGGSTFAALGDTLRDRGAVIAVAESDAMWTSWASGHPGMVAGMSAVPSIHVAVSFWIYLVARTMAPRAAKAAFIYFALIWLGSVQLGWHYAVDGLAGALGMLGVWKLADAVQGFLQKRALSS